MNTVLGIDLGTQHLKVVFYDFEKRTLAAVQAAPLDLHQAAGGVAEQQADWWLDGLQNAMQKVAPEIKASVKAIAVSGQQHGFVAVDRTNDVLLPVKLWCDTSTQVECEEIMAGVGGTQACINSAGNPVLPGYTASKILWMKKNHPGRYERLDCILLPHDYLNLYLTGERCMEAGDASGTALFDVRNRSWSSVLLRATDPERDLANCLPPVNDSLRSIGSLLPDRARTLGLPAGIPVAPGGGDNMMGALGTGNVRPGVLTISLGTSGTVYAYSASPVIDPKGNIAAFCSSTGGWLPLLCTMNCTVSTELMRGVLSADIEAFEAQVARAPSGAQGVLTLPFFTGERTPNLPHAKGCIVGLDAKNTRPENLLRSAMEGATFALRFGVEELAQLGTEAKEVVLTGGGANSATWRQVAADVFNLPVTMTEQTEGAAFGAALQAVALLENESDLSSLVSRHLSRDEARCCEPGSAAAYDYESVYQAYQEAVGAVTSLYGDCGPLLNKEQDHG